MRKVIDDYREFQKKYAAYEKWNEDENSLILLGVEDAKRMQAIHEFVSEAGEVLGVATKAWRKGLYIPRDKIVDELGDAFWGLVGVLNTFDISLEELIEYNVQKLEARNAGNQL